MAFSIVSATLASNGLTLTLGTNSPSNLSAGGAARTDLVVLDQYGMWHPIAVGGVGFSGSSLVIGLEWGLPAGVTFTVSYSGSSVANTGGDTLAAFSNFGGTNNSTQTAWTRVNGWTLVKAQATSRVIYCDSSRPDDSGNGLSIAAAKKTIASAMNQARDGQPDLVLFKRGQTWTDESFSIEHYGAAADQPHYIGTYEVGDRPRFNTSNTGMLAHGGTMDSLPLLYFFVHNLDFYAYTHDPDNGAFTGDSAVYGFFVLRPGDGLTLEGCRFDYYGSDGVTIQGEAEGGRDSIDNVKLHRCVIRHTWRDEANSHASGGYFNHINDLAITECLVDHNGWHPTATGAVRNIFNHGIYLSETGSEGPVLMHGNILARSSSHGTQIRGGNATVTDNLIVRNAIGLLCSRDPSELYNNVILESDNINDVTAVRGWGMELAQCENLNIHDNIVAHRYVGLGPVPGLDFTNNPDTADVTPVICSVDDNIVYDWDDNTVAGIRINGVWTQASFTGNYFDGVWQGGGAASFVDPDRTVDTYDASLGGPGTLENFLDEAAAQCMENWRTQYTATAANDYIRAGFVESSGDTTRPTATLTSAPNVTIAGGTSYDLVITFTDNAGISIASLQTGNIRVTGPGGYNVLAQFISVDVGSDGTPRAATYRITPPGGSWDSADNGVYDVRLIGV